MIPRNPEIVRARLNQTTIKDIEEMSDLQKKAVRFGLTEDMQTVNGVEVPLIVSLVYHAWENKKPEDEVFLREELQKHNITYSSTGDQQNAQFTKMAFILYRIAGCTEVEIKGTLLLDSNSSVAGVRAEDIYASQVNVKVRERKQFMLLHPEFDWKKERISARVLRSMGEMLQTINNLTGLNPLEIFNPENIPEYASRKIKHSKSNNYRSLKVVLDEIVLLLTIPNWKEIERLTQRDKWSILNFATNKLAREGNKTHNMLSLIMVKKIVEKRKEFQSSAKARMYPIDRVDYSKILGKISTKESAMSI